MWQLMAAGTALNMYSSYKQGRAEAKSLLAQANAVRLQGEEQYRRYEYNAEIEKEGLRQSLSSIRGSAAAKGIGGHAVEQAQAYTSEVVAKNLAEMKRQAEYERNVSDMESRALRKSASSAESLGWLKLLSGGLTGTASAYDIANRD